jgi:hypothetical protein
MKNKVEIVNILVYSPKKKNTKPIAECSVKNPATYSDSASGRSIGGLFVSAIAEIINRKAIGNYAQKRDTTNWPCNIFNKSTVPYVNITDSII